MDRVEHSQNRAPNTVTEIHFGLRSAETGASCDTADLDEGQYIWELL